MGPVDEALSLIKQGWREEAERQLRVIIEANPHNAQAVLNLGVLLAETGRVADAITQFEAAISLLPSYAEAHLNLASALSAQGRSRDSEAHLRTAWQLRPNDLGILIQYGSVLMEIRKFEEASVVFQHGCYLSNSIPDTFNGLARALLGCGRLVEAEKKCLEGLKVAPTDGAPYNTFGSIYRNEGRLNEAITCFNLALQLNPEETSARWNRSIALLQMGDYEHGWSEYECRLERPYAWRFKSTLPVWDGSPLNGRRVLVHGEQGLGDVLQFIRYARLLKNAGTGEVIVASPVPLLNLIKSASGVDKVIKEDSAPPEFDVHIPIMSLPHRFNTTLQSVPRVVPYIIIDQEQIAQWREKLQAIPGFKVGIVWQGNPHHEGDRFRSVPLELFEPLAEIPGVRLISLQHIFGLEQLATWKDRLNIFDPTSGAIDMPEDFEDTAAIIQNLDLVITVDTAVAHLAGALGARVWTLLGARCDWRWMLHRSDTPWYPTMRLFRQKTIDDWESVFDRVARKVERLVGG